MSFSSSLRNRKWTLNAFKVLFVVGTLTACQGLRTRDEIKTAHPIPTTSPAAPVFQNQPSSPGYALTPGASGQVPAYEPMPNDSLPPAPVPPNELPHIGIILSGGGARTYGHIGFLQEMARLKIPVHAIAGIEFGAPMAALYANKGLANEVEWQMFKLKDEDLVRKSLLSSNKSNDISSLNDFMRLSFGKLKVEDFRLGFACPALNLSKGQVYLMSRGSVDALLPYCWPYPPLFHPYKSNVSAVREVKMLADYLRSRGANYIIFVNALGGTSKRAFIGERESTENILWSEVATQYARAQAGVDATISLATEDYGLADFDKRREIMQKGADSSGKSLRALAKRWGL